MNEQAEDRRRPARPHSHVRRVRAGVLAAVVVAEVAAFVILSLLSGPDPMWIPVQVWLVGAYGLGGSFIVRRQPGNTIGWILWAIGAILGLDNLASAYAIAGATLGVALPGEVFGAWFANWSLTLVLALALGFLPLLFPDGRPPSRRWGRLLLPFGVITVLVPLGDMLRPGPIDIGPAHLPNPTGLAGPLDTWLTALGSLVPLVVLPIVIAAGVTRYRRGTWIERQQLKWFTAAVAVTLLGLVSTTTLGDLLGPVTLLPTLVALGLMPIAIGIAVTRYHLYQIDRIISRTVGWTAVTLLLVAVFAGGVIGLEGVLAGVTQGQTLAVAGSTLVVFALFQPVRRRVQSAVDRRFDRARYDAQRTLVVFAEQLRGELDLDQVRGEMLAAVSDTMRPRRMEIWLRGDAR